eukprot:1211720-Pleurochrysis_carterae.AAC.1
MFCRIAPSLPNSPSHPVSSRTGAPVSFQSAPWLHSLTSPLPALAHPPPISNPFSSRSFQSERLLPRPSYALFLYSPRLALPTSAPQSAGLFPWASPSLRHPRASSEMPQIPPRRACSSGRRSACNRRKARCKRRTRCAPHLHICRTRPAKILNATSCLKPQNRPRTCVCRSNPFAYDNARMAGTPPSHPSSLGAAVQRTQASSCGCARNFPQ